MFLKKGTFVSAYTRKNKQGNEKYDRHLIKVTFEGYDTEIETKELRNDLTPGTDYLIPMNQYIKKRQVKNGPKAGQEVTIIENVHRDDEPITVL